MVSCSVRSRRRERNAEHLIMEETKNEEKNENGDSNEQPVDNEPST